MKLMTLSEAAGEAGRTVSTVHRWIKEGRFVEGVDYHLVGPTNLVIFSADHLRAKLPALTALLETRGAGGRARKPRS